MSATGNHWTAAAELDAQGDAFVVVTMIAERGHVPQDLGAKCIVTASGLHSGTVGGGKVEARAIEEAKALLASGTAEPKLVTWNLTRDIGMTCGGEATFLFEIHHRKKWSIVVFGAGHVGQALTRTLLNLDCQVTCVDFRADWLSRLPDSPKLSKVLASEPEKIIGDLSPESSFVVMTRGHASDVPILDEIFRRHPHAPYVGVMGSDVKAARIRSDLLARGIDAGLIERLRSPIGLDLGGNDPYEIAISVVAELLKVRDEKRVPDRLERAGK
ncbi:MAG: xanthine dehydrogenase accessory protein XdhC [Bdellovibrionota bacterium]